MDAEFRISSSVEEVNDIASDDGSFLPRSGTRPRITRQSLPALKKVKFLRFVLLENPGEILLHGFASASEKGFGADIYIYLCRLSTAIKIVNFCAASQEWKRLKP
ncbi:hypothetical protein NPIL_296771 [Nephila pilipes]|uniref:Uncharacterized protein n=1 Tax=Nephila pilipes TaxID=299642 RepID=A0A8X6Q5I5_NEPPI|nr:hypothetical protein NPIL_296771 [Nephila pilipes]